MIVVVSDRNSLVLCKRFCYLYILITSKTSSVFSKILLILFYVKKVITAAFPPFTVTSYSIIAIESILVSTKIHWSDPITLKPLVFLSEQTKIQGKVKRLGHP